MPELPEVETSRRGIEPHILNQTVTDVIIRQKKLRWPIPSTLKKQLLKQAIQQVDRRGKYILLRTQAGTVIIHLGMSGSCALPTNQYQQINMTISISVLEIKKYCACMIHVALAPYCGQSQIP